MTNQCIIVSNPGSAIGEAIGATMQNALNNYLSPLIQSLGYIYLYRGPYNRKTGKYTKLILTDEFGTDYNIDAVIINEKGQPLILLESKYIRYKKHNRDKGSWVCTSHQSLRRRFSSIRSSITVLAGNWSKTSKAMMVSFDISLFEIPFDTVVSILKEYDIDFEWGEKEKEKAREAWDKYCTLTSSQKDIIGSKIVSVIEEDLRDAIVKIVDESLPREIQTVEIHILTNLGEIKVFKYDNIEDAMLFLQEMDNDEELLETIIKTDNSPTIYDNAQSTFED